MIIPTSTVPDTTPSKENSFA